MNENKIDCFVIMPIGDCDGYNSGHFTRVYEDIIKPAVSQNLNLNRYEVTRLPKLT